MGRARAGLIFILTVGLIAVTSGLVWGLAAAATPQGGQEPTPQQLEGKKAEDFFKNIKVLNGVPADQVIPAMQFITASLGVECEYCHVRGAFDKDDKLPKETARKMIKMMFAINKDSFEGKREVTCYSCHHGSQEPVPTPILSESEPPPMPPAAPPPGGSGSPGPGGAPEGGPGGAGAPGHPGGPGAPPAGGSGGAMRPPALPAGAALIDKYVQALGGADALAKITSRVEKGKITAFGGQQYPIEVYAKAPDKRMSVMHTPRGDSITAFDGQRGWLAFGDRPPRQMFAPEAEGAKLDADLHFATDIKQLYNRFRVFSPEKVGDRDAYPVLARAEGKPPLRLYFDKDSGLLVRLIRYQDTPLGMNPTEIDYADYRDTDGVKVPYRWTLARPGGRFTIQVESLEQNVQVDDAKFVMPAAKASP
jgi:photosynthetic reaction center cytochrome c subunit